MIFCTLSLPPCVTASSSPEGLDILHGRVRMPVHGVPRLPWVW
ncbi:hypothetical protein E2C01_065279 [Portunus trituberculatus]|uniref:Uncharacterized protein n=1 Tax=Portunus trituberculatus TaxID=210409 RepID=A0A5B7HIF1_PORTR|nr:hypothetical protein [Portunus trituberculatus]